MTSLREDADYIQEVTQCLSQSMVHILQNRPRDPIEYLAECLRNYRRDHPVDAVSSKEHQSTLIPDQVISGRELIGGNKCSENVLSDTVLDPSPTSQTPSGRIVDILHAVRPHQLEDGDDDYVQEYVSGEFSHIVILHKSCQRVMLGIGDLFDDYDFG